MYHMVHGDDYSGDSWGAQDSGDHQRIMWRLDLWEAWQHAGILTDTLAESRYQVAQYYCVSDESYSSDFKSKVLDSKICAAVIGICR